MAKTQTQKLIESYLSEEVPQSLVDAVSESDPEKKKKQLKEVTLSSGKQLSPDQITSFMQIDEILT